MADVGHGMLLDDLVSLNGCNIFIFVLMAIVAIDVFTMN